MNAILGLLLLQCKSYSTYLALHSYTNVTVMIHSFKTKRTKEMTADDNTSHINLSNLISHSLHWNHKRLYTSFSYIPYSSTFQSVNRLMCKIKAKCLPTQYRQKGRQWKKIMHSGHTSFQVNMPVLIVFSPWSQSHGAFIVTRQVCDEVVEIH